MHSIRKTILKRPPANLLYFAFFGSQVRGTERPDSDLDFLYVVEKDDGEPSHEAVCDAIRVVGGMDNLTRLRYTKRGISQEMNVYGLPPYRVLRGEDAMVIYRAPSFNPRLDRRIRYEDSALVYFNRAARNVSKPRRFTKFTTAGGWCFYMHHVVSDLLKAGLLFNRTSFPYTKDIRVLYGLLPPAGRPKLDVDEAQGWGDYWLEHHRKQDSWEWGEARRARRVARRILDFTSRTYNVRGSVKQ